MDKDVDEWFGTWIAALESPLSQIDALGIDGTVAVSFGDLALTGATMDRAIAYV